VVRLHVKLATKAFVPMASLCLANRNTVDTRADAKRGASPEVEAGVEDRFDDEEDDEGGGGGGGGVGGVGDKNEEDSVGDTEEEEQGS
jgi:hypothetical protein